MTWYWDIRGGDLTVWDHTQDPATDSPFETVTNSDGWAWDSYPDAILDAMYDEAQTAVRNQNTQRAIAIVLDMAGEQIEQVEQ